MKIAFIGYGHVGAPLAEGAVLGACVGAALAGLRPIGEMQFNDFVATGFNQLVNNAAKIRYRWGGSVPMVVRMPWGGLRHAGPYHSQNTEAWFYRTPGLKIVVPSTPEDARALMASAVADPDPVLFYEHIALYRDPRVKQALDAAAQAPLPIGRAARVAMRTMTLASTAAKNAALTEAAAALRRAQPNGRCKPHRSRRGHGEGRVVFSRREKRRRHIADRNYGNHRSQQHRLVARAEQRHGIKDRRREREAY